MGNEDFIGWVKARTREEFIIEFSSILIILVNQGLGEYQVKLSPT